MTALKIISLLLLLFLSTSFLTVSFDDKLRLINYFFAVPSFILIFIFLLKKNVLEKSFFKIIWNYYLAIMLSTFGFLIVYIIDNSQFSFKEVNMYGRILNVILFSTLAWFIVSLYCYNNEYFSSKKIASFYAIGCFLLILTGYWQALSLYLGIGSFPFETRSMVHGAGKADYDIQGRLTGIAAEPSFFVPFVLDFIILSLIIFKKNINKVIFFSMGMLVLILSFSPSGYVSAFGSLLLALILVANFKSKKYVIFISTFLVFILFFVISALDKFKNIGYIFSRVDNIGEDVRFQTIIQVLNVFFNSNILTILFGYGVTNFKFAALHTNYDFFETSNNVLIDVLVEMGFIGLFLFLGIFLKIFLLIKKSSIDILQKFVCYALFFDLLITGMVRADYASSRFFIIIALIVIISKYNVNKKG